MTEALTSVAAKNKIMCSLGRISTDASEDGPPNGLTARRRNRPGTAQKKPKSKKKTYAAPARILLFFSARSRKEFVSSTSLATKMTVTEEKLNCTK